LQQKNTVLQIPDAQFILPSKKEGRPFSYTTSTITGRTLLKDISRTFAPVLGNFDYPLNLSLKMNGDSAHIDFRDIHVFSDDHKLTINAYGSLHHFKPKEALDIKFHITPLTVRRGVAARIINQFTVKKLMMKQLDNLGDLRYNGLVAIRYKNESFQGSLETEAGPINVEFGIDGISKYVTGKVHSPSFQLGSVMDMEKSLGDVICNADFKVDISKPRTAAIRKEKGGKLPIGHVNATIEDCSYIGIHVRNLSATIESDGSEAEGKIYQHGKRRDLYCTFIFDDTDNMKKMRIRDPGIKFHKISEEDRQAAEDRKQQRAEERAAKKEQRALEKEQKAAEKAAKKAAEEAKKNENKVE